MPVDRRPVREPTEYWIGTFRDVDAFETGAGKVMVCLAKPGHRIAEEFVPVAEVERLREALERAKDEFAMLDHDEGYELASRALERS